MASLMAGRTAVRLPFPELSDREREVLDLLARGYDNATIARRMVLSPKTCATTSRTCSPSSASPTAPPR